MEISSQEHTITPIFNSDSKVLILGTFPSIKSRQSNFFYGHPRNRFWKVIANIINTTLILPISSFITGGSLPVSQQSIRLDIPASF